MHDFFLAKEIVDNLLEIAKEKKLEKISSVSLEIGSITLAHDDLPEHLEDISIENLEFGLKSIARGTILEDTVFDIKKVAGENWKIVDIGVK